MGGMGWIDQAQNRDQWRAPVNTIIGFYKLLDISWVAAQLVDFQEGLSSMKLVSYIDI
jgi:hypothetical protein